MARPLRIGYARVFHEANAHSPRLTEREDFERLHVLRGDELAAATTLRGRELGQFLAHAELTGFRQAARLARNIETVPLFSAMSVPSGSVSPDCFAWIRQELNASVERAIDQGGDLDGIYVALHGSMQVAELDRAPESVLLADLKKRLPNVKLAASYDLHANLSAGIVDPLDTLIAYRSNPHWDLAPTGYRAGRRLIQSLRGEITPVHAWRKLPMTLGGGTTVSFVSPMRQVFSFMKAMEKRRGMVSASLFMVHPYTTAEAMGWAVHVCSNGDAQLANDCADELADRVWQTRKVGLPKRFTISESLAEVARTGWKRRLGPVTLIDEGDIVGAGAPGGSTQIAQVLLRDFPKLKGLVPIHDPALVDALWDTPIGSSVTGTLQGTDGYKQPPVAFEGKLAAAHRDALGRRLRIDIGNSVIAVTDGAPLPIQPTFWRTLGIRLRDYDVMVQKNFFHYRMFHLTVSFKHLLVTSPGATNLDHAIDAATSQSLYPAVDLADWRFQ